MLPEFVQKNYDYGQGFHSNMDKFNSIKDFLQDQRKKIYRRKRKYKLRKKKLDKIASYQEFTDQYNYVENNGDYFHGIGDFTIPLDDFNNKNVSERSFGFYDKENDDPIFEIELDFK